MTQAETLKLLLSVVVPSAGSLWVPVFRALEVFGTPWNATGPVQTGRRLYQGAYGEYANADISNVQLYGAALPPSEISALDCS
ncbi:hypothetical protein ACWCQS_42955 [Streptomyces sp. NPDC002076]